MANIALLGFGTVGQGVYEVLRMNKEAVTRKAFEDVTVKRILKLRDYEGEAAPLVTKNADDIFTDDSIDYVVECMGGIHPAYEYTKKNLELGKTVITSNKALVAEHGVELLKTAAAHRCSYLFEGAVGGGIPVLRPIVECLPGDKIEHMKGILNGTTNYILTKMYNEGLDFSDVLRQAQELGYAEADPAADIEGHDAVRKTAILASLMLGRFVDYKQIETEGITKITKQDILFAKQMDMKIKLVGRFQSVDGKTFCKVSPCLLARENPLFMVDDVFNSITLTGNAVGQVTFTGRGAGKLPTASAVVGDIVYAVKHHGQTVTQYIDDSTECLENNDDMLLQYYVRVQEHAVKNVKALFGDDVLFLKPVVEGETAFVTVLAKNKELKQKIGKIDDVLSVIMVD